MKGKITTPPTFEHEFRIHIQKQVYVKILISTANRFLVPTENMPWLLFRFTKHVVKFNTRHRRVHELIVVFEVIADFEESASQPELESWSQWLYFA